VCFDQGNVILGISRFSVPDQKYESTGAIVFSATTALSVSSTGDAVTLTGAKDFTHTATKRCECT
jgi:hypothetical protein